MSFVYGSELLDRLMSEMNLLAYVTPVTADRAFHRIRLLEKALRDIVDDAFETDGADPEGGSQCLVASDLLEQAVVLLNAADTQLSEPAKEDE